MGVVISTENISKAYQLGVFNSNSFSNDLKRWWAIKRGKSDPFININEDNDRTTHTDSGMVWSLKDINFNINAGDSVGIIGRNGAGKSTLLKVLSQITEPTTGRLKIKGKVASLLEVGTGFHPELTGRDNIFLNGAILGMRQKEIKRKFDEIVAFAGVERYIDTPVKRYSSGMYVRLAFAVAAHLDSDILIVDEVLAVGDVEFQKKCMTKMNDLGDSTGRTILFVSHNMTSIKALCQKTMYLEKGRIDCIGKTPDVIQRYLSQYSPALSEDGFIQGGASLHGSGKARFTRFVPLKSGKPNKEFFFTDHPDFLVELEVYKKLPAVWVAILITNLYGETISMMTPNDYKTIDLENGTYQFHVTLNEKLLPGDYSFNLFIAENKKGGSVDALESVGQIKVLKDSSDLEIDYPWDVIHGYYKPDSFWNINKK